MYGPSKVWENSSCKFVCCRAFPSRHCYNHVTSLKWRNTRVFSADGLVHCSHVIPVKGESVRKCIRPLGPDIFLYLRPSYFSFSKLIKGGCVACLQFETKNLNIYRVFGAQRCSTTQQLHQERFVLLCLEWIQQFYPWKFCRQYLPCLCIFVLPVEPLQFLAKLDYPWMWRT